MDKLTYFDLKVFCWMKQRRTFCAIHKVIYYKLNAQVLHDQQYDYVESKLQAVENRHKNVSDILTGTGYLSPQDYVDALDNVKLYGRAFDILRRWEQEGCVPLDIPFIAPEHTEEVLYNIAVEEIRRYPV